MLASLPAEDKEQYDQMPCGYMLEKMVYPKGYTYADYCNAVYRKFCTNPKHIDPMTGEYSRYIDHLADYTTEQYLEYCNWRIENETCS